MARVKSKGTGAELLMAALLKRNGLRFRAQAGDLPGKPDFVLRSRQVAIFVDGEFWHGRGFARWKSKLDGYWLRKISRNMHRDRRSFAALRKLGWSPVRVWESDLLRRPEAALFRIRDAYLRSRGKRLACMHARRLSGGS